MIRKIRKQFEETRGKKHHKFDDFDSLVRRCLKQYPQLFPKHKVNKDGSRVVYHFNVEELNPISLEKEHGSREYLPPYYSKLAITGIEDLISHIENASHGTGMGGSETGEERGEKDNDQSRKEDNGREES